MRLATVRVTEFKSVQDSGEFVVSDVTCLVGKNESGKTAVLEALYRLNPIVEADAKFNVTEDYPRLDVYDYQQEVETKKRAIATVITAVFTLDDDEVDAVNDDFEVGVLPSRDITVTRGYDSALRVFVAVAAFKGRTETQQHHQSNRVRVDRLVVIPGTLGRDAATPQWLNGGGIFRSKTKRSGEHLHY